MRRYYQYNMTEKKFNFGEAYKEIEEIGEWFQKESIDLDEAIKKYERGLVLIAKCKERLKETENKLKEIQTQYAEE